MANIANDYIHISSLPGKRLIWVIDNEIWLYFPSCIKGTRTLTVFPIIHHRNTKFDYFRSCIIGTRNLTVFPIMHYRNIYRYLKQLSFLFRCSNIKLSWIRYCFLNRQNRCYTHSNVYPSMLWSNNNMKQTPSEKLAKPVSIVTTRQFPLHHV
jgi:hypothetical protein